MENLELGSLGPLGKRGRGRPQIAPGMRQKEPVMFRYDFHTMKRLRAAGKAEGASVALMCKRWVLERLNLSYPENESDLNS
jgi:hypothetical protein